ncbi:dihydrofolate reductase [Enterobacter sp. Ap-916]|uniref:dihydrofolate reductase family protein n=1 Tax=Enterobacteriaceae TaxID=543 RepID=UPI00141FDB3D|nr:MULTISPECIES: dihydrofolate reductase family protein [unclassified Enterobacter]NIF58106.1 dihydrofolate reductase [Enterobacter sp. Ap-867]NIG27952.1 dihydrofolate reductase [Enterobacter sp. Ap-916]
MANLVYYVAATLDGYIADRQHQLDWLMNFPLGDDATPYDEFYQTVGAVIMGAETYSWILENSPEAWPYADVPAFIVTHRSLSVPEGQNITRVQGEAVDIIAQAREAAKGKDVWLVGGGKTAAWFAEAGELQRLFVTQIPVVIGAGIPLLPVSQALSFSTVNQRVLKSGAIEFIADVSKL